MFRGSYELRSDDKGRIIVPLKFRALLGEQFIIIKGDSECLFIMTEEEWRTSFEEKFAVQRFLDKHLMRVERHFRDGLMEASVDAQGRVAINPRLREFAGIGLQMDLTMVGMSNRIELWSTERWDKSSEQVSHDDLTYSAAEIGLARQF